MKPLKNQISLFEQIKPRVIFIEDDKELCEDFEKGSDWELFMEVGEHYVIYHKGIYYHPWKKYCRKVQVKCLK